jgi:hypothetical protein
MSSSGTPGSAQNCPIQPNPDIIGVGVSIDEPPCLETIANGEDKQIRVSFYVLSLAGPLVAYIANSEEFTASVESSLGITGLALFLSTVILTARNTLDLFHAICIFHLLGLVGISITPKKGILGGAIRIWTFSTLYVIALAGSLGYLTYVFATAPTFGSNPECNSTVKYVLFGINIPATNPVIRWIFVASFGVILLGFAFWLMFAAGALCSNACDCVGCCTDSDDEESSHELSTNTATRTNTLPRRSSNRSERPSTRSRKKRKSFIYIIGHEIGCIYAIVMLELIIRRNALGPGLNDWTFGQVLAMMMLLGPLIELGSSMLGEKENE